MKLYVSSYRIPRTDRFFALFGEAEKPIKTALITNAKDYYPDAAEAAQKINELTGYLQELGLDVEQIDLTAFTSAAATKTALRRYQLLFAAGGNTFALRLAMQTSGFDQILQELLDAGIVYAGESAGAIVVGASLKKVEEADDATVVPKVIFEGMGIVPSVIVPHVGSADYGVAIQSMIDFHEARGDEVIQLTDSQALIVDGAQKTVVAA